MFIKSISKALLVTAILLFGANVEAQEDNPLPAPTGPYEVGVVWRHWVDESRDEPYDETSDAKREVIVEFLYPAEVSAGAETAPYIDNREQVLPAWSELLKNAVDLDFNTQPGDLDDFQSHAYPNAPLSEDQASYPLLIFSHGASADARMYSAQIEELASYGYVVAAINHVYGAAVTELNDGRVVTPTPDFTLEGALPIWSQDQIFVMDQLEELNANDPEDLFTDHLNLEQLGVFGQSLGGMAALSTCFVDARCKAGASGDGLLFDGVFEQGLEQPFMQLVADGHVFGDQAFFAHVTGPFYEVRVESFQHMNFGDFPLWPNVDSVIEAGWLSNTDGRRSVEVTRAALLAFFDIYLKGNEGTLEDALNTYPEITVTVPNVETSK
jgi:predicted dienelactone hydrolase